MESGKEYYSITTKVFAELTIKGSKFISHAAPADKRDMAEKYIDEISNHFHDATHNCFAYKIGAGDAAIFRFSDAGEPSGTAGRPILQAIEHKDLTNVVAAVTRYFGGTKLGTGGLIRAYHSAALAALEKAQIIKHHPETILSLKFPYSLANAVHQVLQKFNGQILENRFEEGSVYIVQLKVSAEENFRHHLQDISKGKILVEKKKSCQD